LQLIVSAAGYPPRRLPLDKEELTIGRDAQADVVLASPSVSARHARLFLRDGRVILSDLGSTNGTAVNGRKIARPALLRPVDVVRIGPFLLQLAE
jgi:pSer/pThr/pTyr-binding forkhead associated (FHA) protein